MVNGAQALNQAYLSLRDHLPRIPLMAGCKGLDQFKNAAAAAAGAKDNGERAGVGG
ncbi:hypothetical protein PtrSN002B_000030 [Pyrenophora tritici-repentis]|uniref:Uncharacterized protein n=1 Tax=Pyrenophora tritici-repentis TaxID=45151 RepID=A0A2W1F5A9_9PLEO|nr:hypothetical protein PtrV1_12002 [Pyrenophora tritici-repentis]KAF7444796.1 hypothetical protein A1F99_113490 [Pyrenophora tritici-repentis]KAF7564545.1 hypothetical protein PtrM4_039790 [Pyrenophora tritici-repentis]KAI0586727.1 hypothetical protein Alg130_04102 [Pyrenophora tritici-repentis]KAI0589211.1 hypothetical protein Alg215_00366 [Pyrenophora tritici-repentis]